MAYRNILVPMSAVLATLLPAKLQAIPVASANVEPSESPRAMRPTNSPVDEVVLQSLQYLFNTEWHTLILRQSQAGTLYAGHGSHQSHASHASHASHRSGF